MTDASTAAAQDLMRFLVGRRFGTVLADPPWWFTNRTDKVAPEHRRLARYETPAVDEICALPVAEHVESRAHCYMWVPNALLPEGLRVLRAWSFRFKTNIVWHKVRKDGGSDGRGVGFYFRSVTEILLFGIRGKDPRTLPPGRSQMNMLQTRKREHSRKLDEQYQIIEEVLLGALPRAFRTGRRQREVGGLGQAGRRGLTAELEDVCP